MARFSCFEDFFSEIDVMNAYEEEWNERKDSLKKHYKTVWNDYKNGKLELVG